MKHLHLVLLIIIPLALSARQKLHVTVYQDAEYALRWNPEADTLQLSTNDSWKPWMPEGSFGWQLLDEGQLRSMFYCSNDFISSIDFDKQMVLAVVRYDSVSWNFFPREIIFSEDEAHMSLQYEAVTRTLRPKRASVSSALFLVDITEKLRKTGITNLRYSVIESQRGPWPQGQSPYASPSAEFWFPVAYTRQDLYHSLRLKMALLEKLQPSSSEMGWLPDYVEVDGLRLNPDVALTETNYLMIDDSLRWAQTFLAMTGDRGQQPLRMTSSDFSRYFAIVVIKRDSGQEIGIRDIFWAERGLRIDVDVEERSGRTGPSMLVLLMPRGDYGIMSFRENGEMIQPESLR